MRKMEKSVIVKEAVLVPPSDKTPTQVLPLSALDSQLFLRFTIQYLLVYKTPLAFDRQATVSRIKAALARALVPYYPLAGRIRARASGSGLEVVCRAQGAAFIQAVSDFTLSEFDTAPRDVTNWQNLLSLPLKGAPPLVVQLTWLSDGSATLAAGFSHCLCDGIGSVEFLNLFSELATGKKNHTDFKPVWDRYLFNPVTHTSKNYQQKLNRHLEFNKVADVCGFNYRFSQERLVPTSVIFNRRRLMELKKMTNSELSCTCFELLSAHIWRSWAKSLKLPPNQTVKLLFSINIREKVKPNLPKGYYGNAFVVGCAQTSVQDLVENGLENGSLLVKRAKESVNDEYVKEVVELVSSGVSPDSVGVLILSQWSRLGLENLDFGVGRPLHVGPVCCDKYCILLPVYGHKESVKVSIAIPQSAVDKYLCLLKSSCT